MTKSVPNPKQLKSFLNSKHSIQLPSNLLTYRKDPPTSPQIKNTKKTNGRYNSTLQPTQELRWPKKAPQPVIIQDLPSNRQKDAIYKRLQNIRDNNSKISNLSLSKMLSKMVVIGENQENNTTSNFYDFKMRNTINTTSLRKKNIELDLADMPTKAARATSRISNYSDRANPNSSLLEQNISSRQNQSKRLFKKFYLPQSQLAQTIYLDTINPDDKYIYSNGQRVECKRIHNFYTSNMFRKGYDKCFRKTSDSFIIRK